jgi:hypothetical protein
MNTKIFKQWFPDFGSVFSTLGFIATIYFGIWYIPTWIQESQNERIKTAENEIIQAVKELAYTDTTIAINVLSSLCQAKELNLKSKLPLTLTDIISKTEESFMEDKFLPLIKRKELLTKLENIKEDIPKEQSLLIEKNKVYRKIAWLFTILSVLVTTFAVILGIKSISIKSKINKEKEEELEKVIIERDKKEKELEELRANSEDSRKKVIAELKKKFPKEKYSLLSERQWTYQGICLVHDYIINDKFKIAVDTTRYVETWEIQLFGRNSESTKYIFDCMVKDKNFLPKPLSDYEVKGDRIIFDRFKWNKNMESIIFSLKDLLERIEKYMKKNAA